MAPIERFLLFPLLLAGCVADQGAGGLGSAQRDSQLAERLAGRVELPSQACVSTHELRGQQVFPASGAVVFEGPGSLLYLNRLGGGCGSLRRGWTLTTQTPAGRLCSGEIVQLVDLDHGTSPGACTLGRFEPYREEN